MDDDLRELAARIALAFWIAAAVTIGSVQLARTNRPGGDFHSFYNSALAWRGEAALVAQTPPSVDLNNPLVPVLLSPLTWLPFGVARWTWIGAGMACLAAALYITSRARPIPTRRLVWTGAAMFVLVPGTMAWSTGQLTWLLLLLVTVAWATADRSHRLGGVWLGVAVALKPPLAFMAVLLPRTIWIPAAVVSAGLVLASIPLTGTDAWLDWLGRGSSVDWLQHDANLSVWGIAARTTALSNGTSLATLGWPVAAIAIGVWLLAGVIAIRARGDRRWPLALIGALWLSPLGWAYYLPVALGPMLSAWRPSWFGRLGLVLLALHEQPVRNLWPDAPHALTAWAYGLGAMLLWVMWARPPATSPRQRETP